ncbi:MAG: hypothetical protein CSA74_03630 [Rhodobacterales bacterium]|nr:MAG: hypothetical protein CSA74_03630 [Rhodobacterales bacterium]
MQVSGKTPVVFTGSASGFGEAVARTFAARGAPVALFNLDAARGEAVAAEIGRELAGQMCRIRPACARVSTRCAPASTAQSAWPRARARLAFIHIHATCSVVSFSHAGRRKTGADLRDML